MPDKIWNTLLNLSFIINNKYLFSITISQISHLYLLNLTLREEHRATEERSGCIDHDYGMPFVWIISLEDVGASGSLGLYCWAGQSPQIRIIQYN